MLLREGAWLFGLALAGGGAHKINFGRAPALRQTVLGVDCQAPRCKLQGRRKRDLERKTERRMALEHESAEGRAKVPKTEAKAGFAVFYRSLNVTDRSYGERLANDNTVYC